MGNKNFADIISISWGFKRSIAAIIERALIKAHKTNILIIASASNEGANDPITFPASLPVVICIGAADGKGNRSEFTSYKSGVEKYTTLGIAVLGAKVSTISDVNEPLQERRDGTSTAAPVAAGIATLLIEYTWHISEQTNLDGTIHDNMRKLFLAMSAESQGQANRYLAPWSIFESEDESRRRESIMKILKDPLRIKCYLYNADSLVEPEKSWRPVIGLGQYSCNHTTYFSNQL